MDIDTIASDVDLSDDDRDERNDDDASSTSSSSPSAPAALARPTKAIPPSDTFFSSLAETATSADAGKASWDLKPAILELKKQERGTSQRLTTSLDDKIRKALERKREREAEAKAKANAKRQEEEDNSEEEPQDAPTTNGDGDDDSASIASSSSSTSQQDDVLRSLSTATTTANPPLTDSSDTPDQQQQHPLPTAFSQLHLSRPLLRAVNELGFEAPTPIQGRAIPVILKGKDVLASAVTGSGKTAAYLLPVLERLLHRDRRSAPATRVLALVPTRELAAQIASMLDKLAQHTDVTSAVVVGGLSLQNQAATIRSRPDVLISTPGRLIDHLRNTQSFDVDDVEILILDEADRLLELGFAEELKEICKFAPSQRQTLLFSATLTTEVNKLADLSLNNPVRVSADPIFDMSQRLVQEFVRVRDETARRSVLIHLCRRTVTERTIIFFERKRDAHVMSIVFGLLGFRASELHGNLTQMKRLEALDRFRDGAVDYLLCTDLAARGLDVAGVRWVVNFEIPKDLTTYVHRVGRTARAGMGGRSITLVGEDRRSVMRELLKRARNVANMKSRNVKASSVMEIKKELDALDEDVERVLEDERVERELRIADMEAQKAQNMIDHRDEILGRPRRTWFQTQDEKSELKKKKEEEEGDLSGGDGGGGDAEKKGKAAGDKEERKRVAEERRKEKEKLERKADMAAQMAVVRSVKKRARKEKIGGGRLEDGDEEDDDDERDGGKERRNGGKRRRTRDAEDALIDSSGKRRAGVAWKRGGEEVETFRPDAVVDRRDRGKTMDVVKEPRMLKRGFNKQKKSFHSKQRYKRR